MAELGTYAGQQPNWVREGPVYPVDVVVAESGHEVRTVWGTTRRYRYRAEIVLQGLAAEVAPVVTLVNSKHESGHTFTLVDPVTGSDATVRLDAPLSLTPYRGVGGWWLARFSAITAI